jgi:23S rRNA (adenine2030-N6)-methyltransferase
MNYRHAFHAGNHADVLKHFVLSRVLAALAKKDAPYAYLDSHAGIGLYDLQGEQASRTTESAEGIGRLMACTDVPPAFQDYIQVIQALNAPGQLRYYPGSPELARRLSRAQDRLQLNEKHPADGPLLRQNMAGDRRVAVHLGDGWLTPKALLPTKEKRVLFLIDPPFEQADELKRCVEALSEAHRRMRQAMVMLWYPIKDPRQLQAFYKGVQGSGAPKALRIELLVHAADNLQGLNGSGLVISNPPWGLEEELREVLPWLSKQLAQSHAEWRLDWLIAEA